MNKDVEEIRKRIVNGFAINQIPEKKKKWFLKFAEEEYCDNRGMALAHLIDVYTGILCTGTEHLDIAIHELANEVELIKQQLKKPEEKKIKKMMDGTSRK